MILKSLVITMKIYDLNNLCHKRCYSLAGATYALAKMFDEVEPKRRPKRLYYCDKCNLYHLTSMSMEEYLKTKPQEEISNTSLRKKKARKKKNRPTRKVDMI